MRIVEVKTRFQRLVSGFQAITYATLPLLSFPQATSQPADVESSALTEYRTLSISWRPASYATFELQKDSPVPPQRATWNFKT